MLVGLWAEPDVDWFDRLLGIEGVLVAAVTLLIPVLSRFSSPRRREPTWQDSPPGPAEVRFCPSCGRPVAHGPLGTGRPSVCEALRPGLTALDLCRRSRANAIETDPLDEIEALLTT